jgi:hypothetical protein
VRHRVPARCETGLSWLGPPRSSFAEVLVAAAAVEGDDADEFVANRLEHTIAEADPRQAKALLRLLIKALRVNGRSEILPTYRVVTPEVCALPGSVERTGIEPVTSGCKPVPRR